MCGLAGLIGPVPGAGLVGIASAMADRLAHRGPDDAGIWIDEKRGVALAHRRLSVLDLSVEGRQPMQSGCGRYVLAFNGEIYNHRELRRELEQQGSAPAWRGHSDTETMLAAFAAWGVEASLGRFVGMFAFALWDARDGTLWLARDRIGEKPLYYGECGGHFLFGSELKALRAYPGFDAAIDRAALAKFMQLGYVPAPDSIYRGIRKLPPGTWLRLRPGEATGMPVAYWSARDVHEHGRRHPLMLSESEAADELERLLGGAVSGQMLADVPLGALLSGGIDSSAVVALMQARSARPVRTFTVGFEHADYDEAQHALKIARHLGTEHVELRVSAQDALDVIPRLPDIYDEPFADSSQIPTLLVARLARRQVTVCLTGDGGDEVFGGYNRYLLGQAWGRIRRLPRPLRAGVAGMLEGVPPARWDALLRPLRPLLPAGLRFGTAGDKLHKLGRVLGAGDPADLYLGLITHWRNAALVLGAGIGEGNAGNPADWAHDPVGQMMLQDLQGYLPDDILVKLDRAAMHVSLETRVPMLDHRVIEFAACLPQPLKLDGRRGKVLLRMVLQRYVPDDLVARPKTGFGVPLDAWLRGPLRDWAEALLDETRLAREGYLAPTPIRACWAEHLSGRKNRAYVLWNVLMFQAWLERGHA